MNNLTLQQRNDLIVEHWPIVIYVANDICMSRGIFDEMFIEDCCSVAVIEGLIKAIDKYDDSKGAQLKTWVEIKVKGAVKDYLRREKWPKTREIKVNGLRSYRAILNRERRNNLKVGRQMDLDSWSVQNSIEHSYNGNEDRVINEDYVQKIYQYIDNKPKYVNANKRSSEILKKYFILGYRMREIAEEKGVTEARINQIINRALKDIRNGIRWNKI